jgi:hypothetical protein
MMEAQIDLSQIRGDWYFHMNYVINGINQTLKRALKLWDEVKDEVDADEVGRLVKQQADIWAQLASDLDDKDMIKTDSPLLQEFIDVCRSTKGPCDALEEAQGTGGSSSIYDTTLEQFTEACRQGRAFCDDLEMMREQRPD